MSLKEKITKLIEGALQAILIHITNEQQNTEKYVSSSFLSLNKKNSVKEDIDNIKCEINDIKSDLSDIKNMLRSNSRNRKTRKRNKKNNIQKRGKD